MTDIAGPPFATGNVAELYDLGAQVLKLYKSPAAKPAAFREAALHAAVEALGLPVPGVWGVRQVGARWGIVFDRASGPPVAEAMRGAPESIPDYLAYIAGLHVAIHAHPAIMFPGLKARVATNIAKAEQLGAERINTLLTHLTEMPEGDRLCHGDFHPMNILGSMERPAVIDWPDASRGDPAADACRSYLLLALHAPELAAPYLEAYCRASGIVRETILEWLPCLAAARLAEALPGEGKLLLEIVDRGRGQP